VCSRPLTPMIVHALDHKTQPLLIAASLPPNKYATNQ
jgi:hypothetical protein